MALAEPPAPKTTILEPLTVRPLEIKSSIRPLPSVLSANRTPSSCQRVLADLVKEHISDRLVEKEKAFSFKGKVTFKPLYPLENK